MQMRFFAIRWLRQRIYIDLDGRAGRRIHTPFAVRWTDGSGVFRRPTDLPTQQPMYTISVGTDFSSPGELQRKAFADGGIVGEDIGVIRRHTAQTTFTVPVWRYRQSDLPLTIDGSATITEKKNAECTGSLPSVTDGVQDAGGGGPATRIALRSAARRRRRRSGRRENP